MSSTKVKVIGYLLFLLTSLFLIEAVAFIFYATLHLGINGKTLEEFSLIMGKHYKHIYSSTNVTGYGDFDPITQMQFPANFHTSQYFTINSYGFLENGIEANPNNTFPAKSENTLRVIMLGGSSMFGLGVKSKNKTIAANIERLINHKEKSRLNPERFIQVLNFGHPGAHSSAELAKFSQYLIHLEPDVVISFDGYNDAWYALFEHKRQSTDFEHGVINWSDYSYFYYGCIQIGCGEVSARDFGPLSKLMPTTTTFVARVASRLKKSDVELFQELQSYPPLKYSKFIYEKDGGFHNALTTNWAAMAGLACSMNFKFFGILQPHAFEQLSVLTESEKKKLNDWDTKFGHWAGGSAKYAEEMSAIYDKYEDGLVSLNKKFENCENAHFESFRRLFEFQHQEDFFVDNIHYTEAGNLRIAQNMLRFLENSLATSRPKPH